MSFLKELEKALETLRLSEPHDSFRLWLSSSPHPKFPISILQKCIKVTTEPPKGVKANMFRMYTNMQPDKFMQPKNRVYYKKLVFSLCWFHAIIIERKRFKSLGWNVIYDFNDSDWETADNILIMYVDETSQDRPQQ
jgi:dynein heavy chain